MKLTKEQERRIREADRRDEEADAYLLKWSNEERKKMRDQIRREGRQR